MSETTTAPHGGQSETAERVEIEIGYSEVCCYMRIAGTRMLAERRPHGMVQLFTLEGESFSFPIGAGEAGLR